MDAYDHKCGLPVAHEPWVIVTPTRTMPTQLMGTEMHDVHVNGLGQDGDAEPVFLLGMQRSGTTLLGILLSHHPDICMTVNGKLLYYLIQWIVRDPSGIWAMHMRRDEIAHALSRRPILGSRPDALQVMQDALNDSGFVRVGREDTPRDVARRIWCGAYRRLARGRIVCGDKYNEYLLQLDAIESLFPKAKYVFIWRNAADVAESMCRAFARRTWCPGSYDMAAAKWAIWNAEWIRFRRGIPSARRAEVVYSDLTNACPVVMRKLCTFLGVACEEYYIEWACKQIDHSRTGLSQESSIDWAATLAAVPSVTGVMADLQAVSDTVER